MIRENFISTQGIHNLRDFGGYRTANDGQVRKGLLFRSGQHVHATDDDLARVDGLKLGTVIDLRGQSERSNHPCRRGLGFNAEVLFYDGETTSSPPHMDIDENTTTEKFAYDRMVGVYTRMAENPAMIDMFGRYLRALADRDGASLVHCYAGKDRTGVAATLVLHILGVHPDDQMAEFLLTNQAPTLHVLRDQAVPSMEARLGRKLDEGAIRALLEVHEDYLATYLAEVSRHAGSLDGYISDVLKIDDAVQERLREKFIG